MKRGLFLLFTAALVCLVLNACALEEGFVEVARDGDLTLCANPETGAILVADARGDHLWRSNPAAPDKRAKGVHKMTLQSQIGIGYTSERGTALTALSQTDSYNKDGFSMIIDGGQATATYVFPKLDISVTVHYALRGGCLEVTVPVEEARSTGVNTLTSVDVLPAFGAAGEGEEGYMLVPDGSGALIRFHNGVTAVNEYKANIYGRDPSVNGQLGLSTSPALARTYEQTARLPVFGMSKGDHGFLAIITQNDAKAALHARVSNLSSYNIVYSEFQLLNSGSIIMNKKEFEQSLTGVSERAGLTRGEYTVRYVFLSGEEESSYAGMANAYRAYLIENAGLEKRVGAGDYPLYLDLYGYVTKTAQFLGIPYQKAVPLTTIADIETIVSRVGAENIVVRYLKYLSGNSYGRLPVSAGPQGALGSGEALSALAKTMRENGGALYPDADLLNVYKTGNGFRPLYDAVLTPVNSPQMQYQISYSTSKLENTVAPWYLLSPLKYDFFFTRFFNAYEPLGVGGVSLSGLGDILTADNRTNGVGRQAAEAEAVGVLEQAASRLGGVMIDGGNAYAAALASHVVRAPGGSSGYILCDESVPFWQMVFHGYVPYCLSPVNQSGSPGETALKCLEYGASPLYAFVGRNSEELIDSRMLFLYSADYERWADDARDTHQTLSSVLAGVADREITGHEILSAHARRTDYGDFSVYVNYGDAPFEADGVVVPAKGFAVAKEANP